MECIVEHCNRTKIKAKGLCDIHYDRQLRTGTTDPNPITTTDPSIDWCKCEVPQPEPILMFGWARMLDVQECKKCGRGIKTRKVAV